MDNTLNLTIPTDLTGGAGGLNLNYDFGGNTSTIAQSAYNFLNGAFSNQQGFLSTSLANSQNFLSAQIQPTIQAENMQMEQNAKMLPTLYDNLFSLGQSAQTLSASLTQTAISAQQAIAEASINGSVNVGKKAAGSGKSGLLGAIFGGCYITTAVCDSLHWPDDNPVLRKMRHWRDTYMTHPLREHEVLDYYITAPNIVKKIDQRKDAKIIYLRMLRCFLIPCCHAIDENDMELAYLIYKSLICYAKVKAYGNE